MGSATRHALAEARAALTAQDDVDLTTAEDLFGAARVIGSSSQLMSAIADTGVDDSAKRGLVNALFGTSVTPAALELLDVIASLHWSRAADVLAGIEDLGLRAAARSVDGDASIDDELFSFGHTVSSNSKLELSLSSKLGDSAAKVSLVRTLLDGKASSQTIAILSHLVQLPRGRRMGELVLQAAAVVADASGYSVATVTSALPLSDTQVDRLVDGLAARYGQDIRVNQVVDPAVIGGLRVQVGDDVTDGSIAKRLGDLRLSLTG